MKNFILVFGMSVFAFLAKAQIISWLPTNENRVASYGNSEKAATCIGLMEFQEEDLFDYKSTVKDIKAIDQIIVYIDSVVLDLITDYKVVIMQGEDINSAARVVSQTVPIGNLTRYWNTIALDNVYNVDLGRPLYIGYEVTCSSVAYPLSVAAGNDPRQAWFRIQTESNPPPFDNIVTGTQIKKDHVLLIKARASVMDNTPDNEVSLVSVNFDRFIVEGDSAEVSGKVINRGQKPITSFDLYYEVDGIKSPTANLTGLNIPPKTSYDFVYPDKVVFNGAMPHQISVTTSNPNGVTDVLSNNTRTTGVLVTSEREQRIVLQEVFSSSTSGPARDANEALEKLLSNAEPSQWACIKYQMDLPGNGDPYYTDECDNRRIFYAANIVPTLIGDGTMTKTLNTYTISDFNQLSNMPAAVKTTGSATVDTGDRKVSLTVTINPLLTYDNPNLGFFAAIVEKETFNNIVLGGSNGEKYFRYVMKKFMTGEVGILLADAVGPLELGKPITFDYDYTFNGRYRQPQNAKNPIKNDIEHSVENFEALLVVYWLQDVATRDVYQAGIADPNPNYVYKSSVAEFALNPNIRIFPNPANDNLNIFAAEPIKEISIYSILGQKVGFYNEDITTIPVADLAKGMYFITVKTENSVSNQKFVKK
ncbi:MAG: T9SS type A sorting domain-containing protein [Lentimicrobiaceae bacterium]|nr:T9SS type A sorting domain-containing protein [Lentimicrobiaceae bacterium]